jgi:hypothetical protein
VEEKRVTASGNIWLQNKILMGRTCVTHISSSPPPHLLPASSSPSHPPLPRCHLQHLRINRSSLATILPTDAESLLLLGGHPHSKQPKAVYHFTNKMYRSRSDSFECLNCCLLCLRSSHTVTPASHVSLQRVTPASHSSESLQRVTPLVGWSVGLLCSLRCSPAAFAPP